MSNDEHEHVPVSRDEYERVNGDQFPSFAWVSAKKVCRDCGEVLLRG